MAITGLSKEQILRIIRSLAGHVDLRAAIKAVSIELQPVVPHDHFDAALFTEDKDSTVVYETGLKTSWGSKNGLNKYSPIRKILSGEESYLVTPNAMLDDKMSGPGINAEPIRTFKIKSRVHARIEVVGELIGALSLSSQQESIYSEQHIQSTLMIADIVGPYLYALQQAESKKRVEVKRAQESANARGFRRGARLLTDQLERERERIGMDLHDQTLADLTRMIRRIDDPTTQFEDKLSSLRTNLIQSAKELRNIIDNAKPSLLHLFGLVEAVDGFLSSSIDQFNIKWRIGANAVCIEAFNSLSELVALNSYRIIQEAINNVVSHSNATEMLVEFGKTNENYFVAIEDNGNGIQGTIDYSSGGMENMKTRAALIGATIEISSSTRFEGTRVQLEIPASYFVVEVNK